MKNNKKRILLVAILLIALIAIIFGYTYSKYIDSYDASAKTVVAKWKFSGELLSGGESSSSINETVSLVDTVKSGTVASNRIAPGTKGSFDIVIDATGSEVDLKYDVSLISETAKPKNLYFTYAGKTYESLSQLLEQTNSLEGVIKESDENENKTKTLTIGWEWPYETLDGNNNSAAGDVQDSKDSTITDYTFSVKITGTQIDEDIA